MEQTTDQRASRRKQLGTRLTAILCLLALAAGCGGKPEIRRLTADSVIVAFGDSLTTGTGADKGASYPARLAERLGCRVVNAGVPGEDTTAGLARLPSVLRTNQPDLIIICHGGNDMLAGQDRERTRQNIMAMISLSKDAGADVVLVAVPRPGLLLKAPPFYRQLADAYDVPMEADALRRILRTPALKSDQIHPNAAGYRQLAAAIAKVIERCGSWMHYDEQ